MKMMIIDGNNLLHKIPKFKQMHANDMKSAATALREYVKSRIDSRTKLLIIFDGHGESTHNDMRYSGSKSADDLIRAKIEEKADLSELTIISSDAGITGLAKVCGCNVVSSDEFARTLEGNLRSPAKGKDVNELFEKPDRSSKKEIEEFKKYFT